ncbi:helix-turn-helix domain-containing protein [Kribbella sp. VKM Ac-2568]|uniref:helix-turn-helix domain-containing protein n=1 Tax=Kribbella sp. VKM Ac-2568 TaxID=2512219 RepID=UPI001053799D|nr:helix-turn-helix domain-containing protein [Kribbella sp. VKM Ac-2568]TCM45962.1 IclR family transcriptional regulator [Kribbella sp. VKM Ac-2568]
MQSLSRALTVLAELNRQNRPYGVTELAVAVGLHKSTVHRILITFCEHGLVDRVGDHQYCAAEGLSGLRGSTCTTAGPGDLLSGLGGRLGRTVVLARPGPRPAAGGVGCTVLEVAAVAGPARGSSELRPTVKPGDPVSLHRSALGRAYLSAFPASEVDAHLADSGDRHNTLAALHRARETGFAHNSRPVASLPRMVAVPVRDADGQCVASLGAELAGGATAIEEIRVVLTALTRGARQLSAPPAAQLAHRRGA